MRCFYRAGDRVEAFLLADRLAQAGIRAHVFNQNMSSIVGDVPPDVGMPQVWLDDDVDLERAEAVLREYRAERSRTGAVWCRACGEENPATFELCWKCGGLL